MCVTPSSTMTTSLMMTLPSHMSGFLHELGPSTGVYSYVSYPSAVMPTPSRKYRSEQFAEGGGVAATNLMQNKRVVRGNTYAQRVPIRTFNVTSTLDEGTPSHHRKMMNRPGKIWCLKLSLRLNISRLDKVKIVMFTTLFNFF